MDPLHSKCFALPAYRTTYFSLQPCPSQSESLQLFFWNFWYLFLHFLSLSSFLAARYHRACPPSRALHVCWSVRSALALGSSYAHAPNGRNIAYRWNRRQVYTEWRTADIYNFYEYIYTNGKSRLTSLVWGSLRLVPITTCHWHYFWDLLIDGDRSNQLTLLNLTGVCYA